MIIRRVPLTLLVLLLSQFLSKSQTESLDSVVKTVVQAFNDRDTTLLKEVIMPERFHVDPPDSLLDGMDKAAFTYKATQMMHVVMFKLSCLRTMCSLGCKSVF